jgi:hypothetical protein
MFSIPNFVVGKRLRAYDRKVESLVMEVQRQNGLPCTPLGLWIFEPPNVTLTRAMVKLTKAFELALLAELADIPPPILPSGLLPVLAGRVAEDQLPAVLSDLRAAAKRLHEEDDTPTMHVTRFFARLRGRASPE